jgi:hypothetical protein
VALEDGGLINGVMEGLGLVFRRAGGGSGSGGRCGASRREDGESVHSSQLLSQFIGAFFSISLKNLLEYTL